MTSSAASPTKTPTPRAARRELARRELARRHLLDWSAYVSPLEASRPAHVRLLAEKLEAVERGEIRRLMVFMPPRHAKSTIISRRFTAWYLGRNPDRSVILASYGADLATKHSRVARNDFAADAPRVFGLHPADDSKSVSSWAVAGHLGGLEAVGVGGPITGKGAHLLVIDDPVKGREEAESEVVRERTWDWWLNDAKTRLEPEAAVVLVMHRWHEDDLAGRLLRAAEHGDEPAWDVVRLPAIAEDEDDALGRGIGEALWPERFPAEALEEHQSDARVWASLYQQRPNPARGAIFDPAWWEQNGRGFYRRHELPESFDRIILSWDFTFKDEKASKSGKVDFVVGQVWGALGAKRYLLAQVRFKGGFVEAKRRFREQAQEGWRAVFGLLAARWPSAVAKLVEDKANGSAIIDALKSEIPGLIPVDPRGGKVARANAVAPLCEAGDILLPHPDDQPWVKSELLPELKAFPRGRHDDQVDALTQALTYLADVRDFWFRRMG